MSLDQELRAYVESLPPEKRARLKSAAERFAEPQTEPALYADDPVFQDLVPPMVVCWLWDGGRALRSVLLGARPEEGLILIREGWLRIPTTDLDEIRKAEELGVPLRLALLRRL
jgi:hypothetical protein